MHSSKDYILYSEEDTNNNTNDVCYAVDSSFSETVGT
jgi:hypothetical protein